MIDEPPAATSPAGIEDAARTLAHAATQLGDGAERLQALARTLVGGGWSGPAAERFAELAEQLVLGQRRAERALALLAGALGRFAHAVGDLRDELARAADAAGVAPAGAVAYHDARLRLLDAFEQGRDEALALRAALPAGGRVAREPAAAAEAAVASLLQLGRWLARRDGAHRPGRIAQELRSALLPVGDGGWELRGAARIAWPGGAARASTLHQVLGRIPHAVLASLLGESAPPEPEHTPPRLRLLEPLPEPTGADGTEEWRHPQDG